MRAKHAMVLYETDCAQHPITQSTMRSRKSPENFRRGDSGKFCVKQKRNASREVSFKMTCAPKSYPSLSTVTDRLTRIRGRILMHILYTCYIYIAFIYYLFIYNSDYL